MANNSSSQLSDQELNMDTTNLSDASNSCKSSAMSIDLGSIDVSGSFSALTQNGIGVGYISSLETALQQSDKLILNLANLISAAAADQENADENGAKKSSSISYSNFKNKTTTTTTTTDKKEKKKKVEQEDYDGDNQDTDLTVKTEEETKTIELTEDEHVSIVKEFQSIFNGELYDYLFDTNTASKVKETLLSSPNLSEDLKTKIASMDQNEIQANLKSIYVSGTMVSDFSKIIITIFDSELKNNVAGASIFDSSKNIYDVYSFISKQNNPQEQLKEIYFGYTTNDKVDDNVIYFTRSFIDTVAAASDVTYEEILSDTKYQEDLLSELKDLSNAFSVIEGTKTLGEETKSTLYSKIIIKEGQ